MNIFAIFASGIDSDDNVDIRESLRSQLHYGLVLMVEGINNILKKRAFM